jgi:hypothetical protein
MKIKWQLIIFLLLCAIAILASIAISTTEPFSELKNRVIYVFWTGTNEMSENRKQCLENLKRASECQVLLITPRNLNQYIIPGHPLHEAYEYLSYTHRADYLRTYFMHFHGGGYSDIKKTPASWVPAFEEIENDEKMYINGYREKRPGDIANPDVLKTHSYDKFIGNGAYIVRPNTAFTQQWYDEMMKLLDSKIEGLRKYHKSGVEKHPQECRERNPNYPIEWNEMLGRIFHKVQGDYMKNVAYSVPYPIVTDYR